MVHGFRFYEVHSIGSACCWIRNPRNEGGDMTVEEKANRNLPVLPNSGCSVSERSKLEPGRTFNNNINVNRESRLNDCAIAQLGAALTLTPYAYFFHSRSKTGTTTSSPKNATKLTLGMFDGERARTEMLGTNLRSRPWNPLGGRAQLYPLKAPEIRVDCTRWRMEEPYDNEGTMRIAKSHYGMQPMFTYDRTLRQKRFKRYYGREFLNTVLTQAQSCPQHPGRLERLKTAVLLTPSAQSVISFFGRLLTPINVGDVLIGQWVASPQSERRQMARATELKVRYIVMIGLASMVDFGDDNGLLHLRLTEPYNNEGTMRIAKLILYYETVFLVSPVHQDDKPGTNRGGGTTEDSRVLTNRGKTDVPPQEGIQVRTHKRFQKRAGSGGDVKDHREHLCTKVADRMFTKRGRNEVVGLRCFGAGHKWISRLLQPWDKNERDVIRERLRIASKGLH
ncbi:hypothetical protein BDN72DRAFT_939964 [Pluteus cervinus]|uniref:Uncharacterized protein n=1 Tax=Pluteus cervinus TaxID=181527 RepID=A0ACD3A3P7_9AGAR|nr:hypothetical protein BDN72DRAFT_939964 [Pluteus cervinus]